MHTPRLRPTAHAWKTEHVPPGIGSDSRPDSDGRLCLVQRGYPFDQMQR